MIPVSQQKPTQSLRRVLLIEDDRGQARIVEASFAKFVRDKFELYWAATYEEGIDALKHHPFDACLLDYQLGPRSGLDLLREIKALEIDTAVIFVTSESSPEVDDQAMELGALDYLVKFEMTPRSLERALRYAIKLHSTLRDLRRLVSRDPLTGLYNRREGLGLLEHEAGRAREFSRALTLVLLDLDLFTAINEAHGRDVGDQTLATLARVLQEKVDERGTVVRWGGDEFALLLPHLDAVAGWRVAESALAAVRELNFTFSAGVAEWNNGRADANDLIAAAERALREAQAAGGNRVT